MPTKQATTDITLKDLVVNAIQDKKGKSVTHLDLSAIDNIPCEHFIICSGNSQPQVKAIAEEMDLKPAIINKAIKVAHKASFQEEFDKFDELETILETVGKTL